MRALPFGDTVTLRRRELARDADGEVVRNGYGEAQYTQVDYEIEGCAVWPAGAMGQAYSFEGTASRVSQVSTRYAIEFPSGVVADSDDKVIYNGVEWEIEGEPGYYRSPFSGRAGPVEAYLKRTTG